MKQLTIFVDMDGTIESLLDAWLTRLNKKYNQNVQPEEIASWDISRAYVGLTNDDALNELLDDSIWKEVQPINGAQDVLQKWVSVGHKVYIVTATPYQSIKAKMDKLLFRCFPFLSWDNVIIASNKQLLKGDVMIDDGPHNLIGGDYKRILFDAPYNRDIDDDLYDLIRVNNWGSIDRLVSDFAK